MCQTKDACVSGCGVFLSAPTFVDSMILKYDVRTEPSALCVKRFETYQFPQMACFTARNIFWRIGLLILVLTHGRVPSSSTVDQLAADVNISTMSVPGET